MDAQLAAEAAEQATEPKAPITSFEAEMEARMAVEAAQIASGLIAKYVPKVVEPKRWTPQQWAQRRRRRKMASTSKRRQR